MNDRKNNNSSEIQTNQQIIEKEQSQIEIVSLTGYAEQVVGVRNS